MTAMMRRGVASGSRYKFREWAASACRGHDDAVQSVAQRRHLLVRRRAAPASLGSIDDYMLSRTDRDAAKKCTDAGGTVYRDDKRQEHCHPKRPPPPPCVSKSKHDDERCDDDDRDGDRRGTIGATTIVNDDGVLRRG